MNWEFIIQKVSDTSWHIAIMVSVICKRPISSFCLL